MEVLRSSEVSLADRQTDAGARSCMAATVNECPASEQGVERAQEFCFT
jgi:hypothetical protein